MTPQQIILALSLHLAETTVERDAARQEVEKLRNRIAELEADAKTAQSDETKKKAA